MKLDAKKVIFEYKTFQEGKVTLTRDRRHVALASRSDNSEGVDNELKNEMQSLLMRSEGAGLSGVATPLEAPESFGSLGIPGPLTTSTGPLPFSSDTFDTNGSSGAGIEAAGATSNRMGSFDVSKILEEAMLG